MKRTNTIEAKALLFFLFFGIRYGSWKKWKNYAEAHSVLSWKRLKQDAISQPRNIREKSQISRLRSMIVNDGKITVERKKIEIFVGLLMKVRRNFWMWKKYKKRIELWQQFLGLHSGLFGSSVHDFFVFHHDKWSSSENKFLITHRRKIERKSLTFFLSFFCAQFFVC